MTVAPSAVTTPVAQLLTGMALRRMVCVAGCTDHGQLDQLDLRLECNIIPSREHAVSGPLTLCDDDDNHDCVV